MCVFVYFSKTLTETFPKLENTIFYTESKTVEGHIQMAKVLQ